MYLIVILNDYDYEDSTNEGILIIFSHRSQVLRFSTFNFHHSRITF
jgi:hypothetical protein